MTWRDLQPVMGGTDAGRKSMSSTSPLVPRPSPTRLSHRAGDYPHGQRIPTSTGTLPYR